VVVRILGRLDLAVALLSATTGDGYVLTAEPESYGAIGEDPVLPIDSTQESPVVQVDLSPPVPSYRSVRSAHCESRGRRRRA
jgi:hypothetical protein